MEKSLLENSPQGIFHILGKGSISLDLEFHTIFTKVITTFMPQKCFIFSFLFL